MQDASDKSSVCVGIDIAKRSFDVAISVQDQVTSLKYDDDGVMQRMQRHDSSVVQRLAEACRNAQAAGAEAIALGCTCMAPIGDALQQLCALPVHEASRCGFSAALDAATAAATSAAAAPADSGLQVRDPRRIPALLDAWQGRAPTASADAVEVETCPVCVYIQPETV